MKPEAGQRHDLVLDLIIKSYIGTAEPVGSRTLSRRSELGLSPASIRNVMADLEEQGFLKQPHTSAGRVPTDRGYRYWVDSLMEPEELGAMEQELIQEEIAKVRTIEAMAERICKVISELTGNAVAVYLKNLKRVSFVNQLLEELVQAKKLADFLEEEPELFIDGTSRVFEQPEFQDLAKMRSLLRMFDEKLLFLETLLREHGEDQVHVCIGRENTMSSLGEVSLVTKDCHLGRLGAGGAGATVGGVAVVGPTRMHYPKVVAVVEYVADTVSDTLERS